MTTDYADRYHRALFGPAGSVSPEEEHLVFESDTHKEYMLTLGVFDDGDVDPTLMVCFLIPATDCTPAQLDDAFVTMAEELREAAAVQYGRPFPHHAEFWFCETREVENDVDNP